MIDYQQHLINRTYNKLISKLVIWQYLKNKVNSETEQGYKLVKNRDKLEMLRINIINALPSLDGLDISNVRLYMPLVDDVKLLKAFGDTEL